MKTRDLTDNQISMKCHFYTAALAALFLAGCSSMNVRTEEGLLKADQAIAAGGSQKVAQQILRDFDEIPPELQPKAVEILGRAEGETGILSLQAIAEKESTQNNPAVQDALISALISRNDPAADAVLRNALTENRLPLNSLLIGYFLEKDDPESRKLFIKKLKENAEEGRIPEESLVALVKTEDPDAWEYVMSVAGDTSHPANPFSAKALELLSAYQETTGSGEDHTGPAAEDIRLDPENSRSSPVFYSAMLSLYSSEDVQPGITRGIDKEPEAGRSGKPAGKKRGSSAKVTAGKSAVSVSEKKDDFRMEEGQDSASRTRSERKLPPVTHIRYPLRSDFSALQIARYREKVLRSLYMYLGEDTALELDRRIHNALVSYSDARHFSKARLLNSFYTQAFATDPDTAWSLMKRGLNLPMSLGMIMEKTQSNYRSGPMRTYAVSRFFDIPRWQAELLREIAARERL